MPLPDVIRTQRELLSAFRAAAQNRAAAEATASKQHAEAQAAAKKTCEQDEAAGLKKRNTAFADMDEKQRVALTAHGEAAARLNEVHLSFPSASVAPQGSGVDPEQKFTQTVIKIPALALDLKMAISELQSRRKVNARKRTIALACGFIILALLGLLAFSAYKNSLYAQVQTAVLAEDWDVAATAAKRLQQLSDARGAELLAEIWETRALSAMAAEDWDAAAIAAERLRQLSDVRGSELLVETWEAQALAAMAAEDWEAAVTAAERLRPLSDARGAELLAEIWEAQALAAMVAEDWDAAATAAERLRPLSDARGAELLAEIWEAQTLAAVVVGQPRPKDSMVMVNVPAGEFQMGSETGESNEKPVHTVYLDAFWIDRTEVTNAQYARCVAAGVCQPSGYAEDSAYNGAEQPVMGVSWDDAVTYATWVGGRLPTEAEWEYAARGPEGHLYPWGNAAPTCDLANYSGCIGRTTPVGSYPGGASWVGVLDMAGNVWEWVADLYGAYLSGRQVNPTGPVSGSLQVLRGGAFNHDPSAVRCSYRSGLDPDHWLNYYGFSSGGYAIASVVRLFCSSSLGEHWHFVLWNLVKISLRQVRH